MQIQIYTITVLLISLPLSNFQATDDDYPQVIGDHEFRTQVFEALFLLQEKAPGVLSFINHYVKRIEMFEKSGMCVWCQPPTYQLDPLPTNMEKYWLASTVAHDSCHSWLYSTNKARLQGAEPAYETYSGFESERICNAYQLQTLYKLQAPDGVIDWMKRQDGTHCDLNHDGKCDVEDYKLRQYSVGIIKPSKQVGIQIGAEDVPLRQIIVPNVL